MKFNINHYIKVKLSEKGRYILRDRHEALQKVINDNNGRGFAYTPPIVDKYGYTKFQGWHLMQIFGPYMGLGNELPFDTNIIIEENQV